MNTKIFDVYKTSTGLYVSDSICEEYQVGNQNIQKNLKGTNCYQVTEEDLNTIKTNSSENLVPNIVTIFDLQLVLSFTVYRDINHNNKLYIPNSTCIKYEIVPNAKRTINNTTCGNVTEEDIQKIENETKNEKIVLKRKYEDVSLPDEMQPAENLFLYYYNVEDKKSYINREIYELMQKNQIEIEGTPKIINDKNCYSTTENSLKEFEKKTNYRGIEQIIHNIEPIHFDINKTIERLEKEQNATKEQLNTIEHEEINKEEILKKIEPVHFDINKTIERLEKEQNATKEQLNTIEHEEINKEEILKKIEPVHFDINKTIERLKKEQNATKEQLNTIEHEKINKEEILKKIEPVHFDINKTIERIEKEQNATKEQLNTIEHEKINKEEILKKIEPVHFDINKTIERIEKEQNATKEQLNNNVSENQKETENIVIIYKDKRTNKLYAPFQITNQQETTMIMNKPCYEITVEDLNEIKDKKIIIASIYLIEKKEYDIIVCNNKGQLFVSKNILDDLGFYIENPHKILVNSEIYEEITEDDVDLIKSKESDNCHINIIMKQIAPKRG